MSDTNVLLSISMLVSGREEMKKSLESLHYFRDAFPCEVILVDTGCNEEQRALAERYADKVIDFAWCNDFAAARNAGLKEAKGEWFLYMDDDEWFDNPQEIVNFFRTGEYKEYNSASYVVRNYQDLKGAMYDESYPSRMEKLDKEARFVGKIHEYLEPFKPPKKIFSDFVHHYGYVYKNKEEEKRHSERNILPLLEMRKENPGNPRWMLQLAQEYFALEEYEKGVDVCINGLAEWRSLREYINYAPTHVAALFGYILISLDCLKRYEEEKAWLKKALEEPLMSLKYMEPSVAFYCGEGIRMYTKMKEYKQGRDYFRRYMKYVERLGDNREAVEAGTAAVLSQVFQERFIYGTILIGMESLIRTEDYALAEKAFYRMNWDDDRLLHQEEWEQHMLDACCSVAYHPLWVRMMQTLISRTDGMAEMYVVFLTAELEYKRQGKEDKLTRLRRLVSELSYDHRYILYTKILWETERPDIREEERKQKIEGLFRQLFEKCPDEILWVREEVWNVADRLSVPLEPLLLELDFLKWKQSLEQWNTEASLEEMKQWEMRLTGWKSKEDIRYAYAIMKCREGILRHSQEACRMKSGEQFTILDSEEQIGENGRTEKLKSMGQMLWRFADGVLDYYELLFKESVFTDMPEALPAEAQLALKLKEIQRCREQGDDRRALESVRKCLGVYPALENVVDAYAKMYRDDVQRRNKEAEEEQLEFVRIVNTLKATAELQLERKDYQAAKEILLQVQQCVPEDAEVKRMLEQIPEGQ